MRFKGVSECPINVTSNSKAAKVAKVVNNRAAGRSPGSSHNNRPRSPVEAARAVGRRAVHILCLIQRRAGSDIHAR